MKILKRLICGLVALTHLNAIAAPAKPTAEAEQVSCAKPFAKVDSSQLPVKTGDKQETEIFWLTKLRESLVEDYDSRDDNQPLLYVMSEIQSYDQRALLTLLSTFFDLGIISSTSFDDKKFWKLNRLAAQHLYGNSSGGKLSEQYLKGMLNSFNFKDSEMGAVLQGIGALEILEDNEHGQSYLFRKLESFLDLTLNFQKPFSPVLYRATLSSLIVLLITTVSSQSIFQYKLGTEQMVLSTLMYFFIAYPIFAGLHRGVLKGKKNKFNETRDTFFAGLAQDLNDPRLTRNSRIRSDIMGKLPTKDTETGVNSILALNEADALDTLIERMLAQPEMSIQQISAKDLVKAVKLSMSRLDIQIKQSQLLTEEFQIFEGTGSPTMWCNEELRCAKFNSILTEMIDKSVGESRVKFISEAKELITSLETRISNVSGDLRNEAALAIALSKRIDRALKSIDTNGNLPNGSNVMSATTVNYLNKMSGLIKTQIRNAESASEKLDKLEDNLNTFDVEVSARDLLRK